MLSHRRVLLTIRTCTADLKSAGHTLESHVKLNAYANMRCGMCRLDVRNQQVVGSNPTGGSRNDFRTNEMRSFSSNENPGNRDLALPPTQEIPRSPLSALRVPALAY